MAQDHLKNAILAARKIAKSKQKKPCIKDWKRHILAFLESK